MEMARTPIRKELMNSRLLKDYASWIYCTGCNKTVAYLCYVTYDSFTFEYECRCGSKGSVHISFEHGELKQSDAALIPIKNRLCCPEDESPLVSFVNKNLRSYTFSVGCKVCQTVYSGSEDNV